jgi:hypothetical protein
MVRKRNEKLDYKDLFRWLIQEVLEKKKKMGVTFRTFGAEHYELEKIRYSTKNNAKVPNFIINKTCHMGHFLWDMRRRTEI